METGNPIQQDWLSECVIDVDDDTAATAATAATAESGNATQSDTPLGATLPLFAEPEQHALVVAKATGREKLQRQLRGSWVKQAGHSSNSRELEEIGRCALGAADPVLEHLNSAMDLAYSLRPRAPQLSKRLSKTAGVLICRHLVAALKLADAAQHAKN